MADPFLTEDRRSQLDQIVGQMVSNGEPDENIHTVVGDFKNKYGVPAMHAPVLPPALQVQPEGVMSRALTNLPRSAAHLIQSYAPGPSSGNLYEELKAHPGEGNPLNPLVAIPRTISAIAHPFLHPQESFAEDPLGTVNAMGLAGRGLTNVVREMPNQIPTIPPMHPMLEHIGEHILHLPRGTIVGLTKKAAGTAEEAPNFPDLRFQGERTGDVKFRGPIPPVEKPYTPPANVSWTTGTRGTPAQTSEGALLKPLGEDLIPQGQAMPTAKATDAQPTVNGRPVLLDEHGMPTMYTDTAEQPIPMPGKPEAAAALKAKFEGPGAQIKAVHTAADVIDKFDVPRKVQNLMRHFQEEHKSFEELNAMHEKAKATGDWSEIQKLEKEAWKTGKALEASGQAEKGSLVPGTPYKPPSAARPTPGYTPQGEGTWERLLQVYPKLPIPPVTAYQPFGIAPASAWPAAPSLSAPPLLTVQ